MSAQCWLYTYNHYQCQHTKKLGVGCFICNTATEHKRTVNHQLGYQPQSIFLVSSQILVDVCIVSDLSALIWSVLLICCSPAGAVRVCFCGDRSFLTSPINLEGKMEGCILFLRSVSEHSWVWSFILECCFSHFTFNCNLARFRNKEVAKCFQSN